MGLPISMHFPPAWQIAQERDASQHKQVSSLTPCCQMLHEPAQTLSIWAAHLKWHRATEGRGPTGSQNRATPLSRQVLIIAWAPRLWNHAHGWICCWHSITDVSTAIWGAVKFRVWPQSPHFLSYNPSMEYILLMDIQRFCKSTFNPCKIIPCEYLENAVQLCYFGFNVKTWLMLHTSWQKSRISQICKNAHLWKKCSIF